MDSLNITGDATPDVPVYTCIVYVSKRDDGTVIGEVANLDGIQATGASERFVLSSVTREFKALIKKLAEAGETIEFIDPVQPPQPHQRVRSIPIHL